REDTARVADAPQSAVPSPRGARRLRRLEAIRCHLPPAADRLAAPLFPASGRRRRPGPGNLAGGLPRVALLPLRPGPRPLPRLAAADHGQSAARVLARPQTRAGVRRTSRGTVAGPWQRPEPALGPRARPARPANAARPARA